MKANLENFQFIILGNTGLHTFQIGDTTKKSVSYVTLLGLGSSLKYVCKELKRYSKYKTLQVVYNNYMATYDDPLSFG